MYKDFEQCAYKEHGDCDNVPNTNLKAGTDGGEAIGIITKAMGVSAAAAVMDEDTKEVAPVEMEVPGRQTIPRGEL